MPNYDVAAFDPPAPVAQVTLLNPAGGASGSQATLLVDTGADATLLPRVAVERLGIPIQSDRSYELMGFDGSTSFAPGVVLDMVFLQRIFRGRHLLIEAEQGVLGRDVLNHVVLLLDGPARQWSEHSP